MRTDPKLSNLMDPARAGLLVVDVQEKLFPHMEGGPAAAETIVRAIRAAGALEIPVWSTEQYVRGLGPTIEPVRAALDGIGAEPSVEKITFSCFQAPAFASRLAVSGIETLAVCGIESHVCVLQTALEALDRGMDVFVISDAVASRNPAHKEAALRRLENAGCIVGPLEMVLFEMMRTAEHPAFRAVQKIILA